MATMTSLILTIFVPDKDNIVQGKDNIVQGKDDDIILTKDHKTQEVKLDNDNTNYQLSIQDLSYCKQMYAPGEINVELQLKVTQGAWKQPKKGDIEGFFRNKKVTLQYGDIDVDDTKGTYNITNPHTVCDGYYIDQAEPRYKSDSAFVTLKIYSPDKLLTVNRTCRSWTASRLGRDILTPEIGTYKLPYAETTELQVDYSHFRNLAVDSIGDEIHPYLVQYNESFYDFLVRTSNRWGEFMYYENNKLNFGYVDKTTITDPVTQEEKLVDKKKNITDFDNLAYCNIGEEAASKIDTDHLGDGVTHSADILENPLTKDKYDAVKNALGCSLKDGGDIWTAKIIGNLLSSGKGLFDFAVDTVVDESIALGQIKARVNKNNAKFDEEFFRDNLSDKEKAQYDNGDTTFNQFSSAKPIIKSDKYKTILANEMATAKDAVCISFDTAYQDIMLGDIITIQGGDEKYIVVKAYSQKNTTMVLNPTTNTIVNKEKTTYHIVATAEVGEKEKIQFYPTVHPTGHVRKSGPQLAVVKNPSLEDPLKLGRVRVHFPWQKEGDVTPWLAVAHPGGIKGCGSYNRHYEGEEVIIAFADDNLERPYMMCALSIQKQTPPAAANLNDIVHMSPGGQAVKIGDGTGSGFTQFWTGFNPGLKMIKGFYPGNVWLGDFEASKSFEGGIELADKYGMYSIKGSTDGRNVTIKSPYGDVKINAFTGITISAPNGDVKIQGKNVTIEAGNNLTLTSGKNIKDGFFLSGEGKGIKGIGKDLGLTAAAAVTKKLASLVGGFFDFSLLRSVLEVFIRPVEGKLTVKSNRYLALEAGSGKTSYPVDAYWKSGYGGKLGISSWRARSGQKSKAERDNKIRAMFSAIDSYVKGVVYDFVANYITAKEIYKGVGLCMKQSMIPLEFMAPPCRSLFQMVNELWEAPDSNINEEFIGFDGMLKADKTEDITDEMLIFFVNVNGYNPNDLTKAEKDTDKESVLKIITSRRESITQDLKSLQELIKKLKNYSLSQNRYNNYLDADPSAKADLTKDEFLERTFIKKQAKEEDFKQFDYPLNIDGDKVKKTIKQLRRQFYIKLVEHYEFKRTKTGGIMGVGASEPPVPKPFDDNIEADWANYVNSIQAMPPVEKAKKSFMDFAQENFLDPIIKQNGILDVVNDARDKYAFGQGSNGRILFSNGEDTMILGEDIMRVNVEDEVNPANAALNGGIGGHVALIRKMMLS